MACEIVKTREMEPLYYECYEAVEIVTQLSDGLKFSNLIGHLLGMEIYTELFKHLSSVL